jgi:uncharacterized protein YidB (DUF937 family)
MGLMDILNGMQNGPRGQPQPAPPAGTGTGGGGMSPMMMALLGLLAYKAIKGGGLENMLGGGSGKNPQVSGDRADSGGGLGDILGGMLGGGASPRTTQANMGGGGLGDLLGGVLGGGQALPGGGLGGILGGLLGSGAAGNVINGGLRNLVQDMQDNGQGGAARSWVGRGKNERLDPNDLASAVGLDDIDAVAQQTGMPRDQLLTELSRHLPQLVDQLTPDGRLPTAEETSRMM